MTGGMAKYWIIPRVGDKELPSVDHLTGLLQSPHFFCSYVLLKREREKLFKMKRPNIPTVKEKSDEFVIRIQNRYSQLVDKVNGDRA